MRRRLAMLGVIALALSGAATLTTVPSEPSRAASSNATFIIPADDGYGVAECATSTCGKVVADQWCVAQGYAVALEFGPADPSETTGTIRAAPEARPFAITCGR